MDVVYEEMGAVRTAVLVTEFPPFGWLAFEYGRGELVVVHGNEHDADENPKDGELI